MCEELAADVVKMAELQGDSTASSSEHAAAVGATAAG